MSSAPPPQDVPRAHEPPYLLRAAFEVSPTPSSVKDREGRFVLVNSALAALYGHHASLLIGKTEAALNPDVEEVRRIHEAERRVLEGLAAPASALHTLRRPDGRNVWLRCSRSPLRTREGACDHVLTTYTDVTAAKVAAERIRQLEEKLRSYQHLDALGPLTGAIAHDLNNLLGPVIAYADLIREQTCDPEVDDLAAQLEISATHATDMVRDLLCMAQPRPRDPSALRPDEELERFFTSAALGALRAEHARVEVRRALGATDAFILGTSVNFQRVVLNLVKNAFEAIDGEGTVSVATQVTAAPSASPPGMASKAPAASPPAERWLCLEVTDTGAGIPADDLARISEPFFSRKRRPSSGSGLGLSAVYRLVGDMGGSVHVESAADTGTTFSVHIPLDASAPSPVEVAVEAPVLLVIAPLEASDSSTVTMLTTLGFSVDTARSDRETAEKLDTADLVVIDIPEDRDADALETYREVRRVKPGLPCLLLGDSAGAETEAQNPRARASATLAKPCSLVALNEAVQRALSPLMER